MVKHLFVVLAMCVLCNVVYSQQENSSIYHNLDFGYSIKYPDSWELEEYQENQSVSFYKQEENTTIMKHLQISVARWEDGDLAEFINSVNLKDLENLYPDAICSLQYTDAFQLLIATRLSAQCTDKRVNM